MSTLELRHLNKRYPSGDWAVRDLELVVGEGEFFVIVGPSGCGKSTLLRMVAGLEPATGGDVLIDHANVNNVRSNERDVALAFQGYALYPHLTVSENLGFPLRVAHVHEAVVERRIDEVASALQLTGVLDRRPSQLSGGQRQRVTLGRAIVRRPRVLLMDEPLSNLDAKLRVQMRLVITRLQRRLGLTTLYVTHDHDEAMSMGDRLAVMRDGRLEQCDVPMAVYDHPHNTFVGQFLGSPSMNVIEAKVGESAGGVSVAVGPWVLPVGGDELRRRPAWRTLVGRTVALGVRPDDVRPVPDGPLIGSVRGTEIVERRKWVTFELDVGVAGAPRRQTVTAVVDVGHPVTLWEPFRVSFDLDHAHLFDPTTGDTLD